ncbi:TPA: AIPR family protein, partial [Streptococcus suis]|nr:AIPR family protein [Streptococcus suis]
SPNIEKTTAKISIEDRIRSLEIEDEKSNLKSYVVTASLKDLVTELYDKLGNQLFKKNIRIGISNDNEVDTYIGSTLGKENEKFWFYNNGISLYIPNNAQFQMRFNNILYINDIEGVSVLNGAQTLTAVAQKLSELNVENNEFNPKVILRIYTFTDSQINDEHIIDRITISLNRQKPIKIDDIAYTTDFVAYVNGYFNTDENKISDKSKFSFVRRGERTSQNDHQYHLIDFARVKLAL